MKPMKVETCPTCRWVTNAFRLLVRSGRLKVTSAICTTQASRHKRLSAVGPIRTAASSPTKRCAPRHKRLSAVGPIRTTGPSDVDVVVPWESQTPFGCWSDQDGVQVGWLDATEWERHKRLSAVGPIRTCMDNRVRRRHGGPSQTPFGCWSDQDRIEHESKILPSHWSHKRLSAVGPIRT